MRDIDELVIADAWAWREWLQAHEDTSDGVWLVLAKKSTVSPTTLTYQDALEEALCSGWIDGQRRGRDESTFSQRFTPRRPRSLWSLRNVGLVSELEEEGRMRTRGRAEVDKARADGRWDRAYAGAAAVEIPQDLKDALDQDPVAAAVFAALGSSDRYSILHPIITAPNPAVQVNRIVRQLKRLASGRDRRAATMRLRWLPAAASLRHQDARRGFEVCFFSASDGGFRIRGHTTAHEASAFWSVGYDVTVDSEWRTVAARASHLTETGTREVSLTRNAANEWTVGGQSRPELTGCVDVDFESSAVTNTLPVHRLDFPIGRVIDIPAAFVRADDLRVERLEQRYTLTEVTPERMFFHYESATFDFACELEFDHAGLIVTYPGIAARDA